MQVGDTVGGRFVIEAAAGAGGMGSIFRASDLATGSTVALKVLRSEQGDAARFERESRVLASLDHPAIVRYVAHGHRDGSPWLAMEWLAGEDLSARLARQALTSAESLALCARVAHALAAAHALGVVHRDVKPANLLLVDGDPRQVKVLDFGIARRADRATRAVTGTGMLLGTPGYLAPEQARGDRDVDGRADLYALGCVLYECLSGAPAFRADNALALLASVLLADPPRLRDAVPDAPADLDELLAALLSKHPADRPGDAAALARQLEALAQAEAEAGPRPAPARAPASLSTGERRVLCAVLAVDPAALDPAPVTPDLEGAPTASLGPDASLRARLEGLRARYLGPEARVECLPDGAVIFASQGATTAEAARAARLALALQTELPGSVIVLAAGHGTHSSRDPLGAVIARAVALARRRPDGVAVDENAAALLHDRCRLRQTPRGAVLVDDLGDDARPLLGARTPCVGRERELALLGATFAECSEDEVARVVLVTAAAGAGKSRLRREFLAALAGRDEPPRVWSARADVLAADSPLAPLSALVRSAAGLSGSSTPEAERAALAALAARYCAGDAARAGAFLGELTGVAVEAAADPALAAARNDPKLMFEQVRDAVLQVLRGACAAGPLVLVLDDAHWSDGASLLYLDHALRELRERPLMLAAFARPEVHERFPRLWDEHTPQELRLSPLSRRACERLVQRVLGDLPPAQVTSLVDRAGGNAFYLEELLRAVSAGATELPETVLAVVQARLSSLSPEARRALRAASVFGESCWSEGVQALLSTPARSAPSADLLNELCAREVLARASTSRFAGSTEYRFHHSLVHAAAYAMLTADDRALGHGLAAAWLLRAGETDPLVLANHLEAAGERARAAGHLVDAAEAAIAADHGEAALAHAARAEALAPDDRAVADGVARVRLQADFYAGRYESAVRRSLEVVARAAPASPGWPLAVMLGAISMGRSRQGSRLGELEAALASVDPATVGPAADRGRASLALEFFLSGEIARGDAQLAAIARPPEVVAETDPGAAAMMFSARGSRAAATGRLFSHVADSMRALAIAKGTGDRHLVAACYGSSTNTLVFLGQDARCEAYLAEAMAYCLEHGLVGQRGRVLLARGSLRLTQGRYREAVEEARAAHGLLTAASEVRRLVHANYVIAHGLTELGALAEAEELLRGLPEHATSTPPLRVATALLRLRAGDAAGAGALLAGVIPELTGYNLPYRCFAALTAHDAAKAVGDEGTAAAMLLLARAAYDVFADDAPDEEARRGLARNVVDHARVLALCP